jgi:hypothetical protein
MENQNQSLVKIVSNSWNQQLGQANKLFESLSNEQLAGEIAPGRNSGVYLLGHLAAVHDMMLPLLGLGQRLHPELDEVFIKNPDKSELQKPDTNLVRQHWAEINSTLNSKLAALSPEQWLEKHTAVSEEDFKKEPHRNRLNVVAGRTNHLAYHTGQLALLKK